MPEPTSRGTGPHRSIVTVAVIAGLCGVVALVTVLCLHLFGAIGSQEFDTDPLPGSDEQTLPDRSYDPFWPAAPPMPQHPLPPHPGTYR
jgi:hypothetical protein